MYSASKELILYSGQEREWIHLAGGEKVRFSEWLEMEQERILLDPRRSARIEKVGLGVQKLIVNRFDYHPDCYCDDCRKAVVIL